MQIQVRTDDNIQGGESLAAYLQAEADERLARFREFITRVEIYVSDADAGKTGAADKRVVIEARPNSRPAIAVNAEADKVADAFVAALDKLVRAIDSDQGRLKDKAGRDTIRNAEG